MMWRAFLSVLWRPVAAILAALGFYAKGRADARAAERLRGAEAYRETREKVDEAEIVGDDPAAARRWLSERRPDKR